MSETYEDFIKRTEEEARIRRNQHTSDMQSSEYIASSTIEVNSAPMMYAYEISSRNPELADRNNKGKPELSYIDLTCFEGAARVLAFGGEKYSRENWRKGFLLTKLLDSMLRHIAAMQRGEITDPESGLPHAAHIQCNAMFLGLDNNIDDLYKTE